MSKSPAQEDFCGIETSIWKERKSGYCAFPLCCSSTVELKVLNKKQLVKDVAGGGSIIVASPESIPFVIPRHLKKIPIEKWTNNDRVWLNM